MFSAHLESSGNFSQNVTAHTQHTQGGQLLLSLVIHVCLTAAAQKRTQFEMWMPLPLL